MEFDIEKARELSYLCKLTGQDERLVQAGGGNVSVKLDSRYMLVKSSGFQLSDVTESSGYSVADYARLAERFARGDVDDAEEQELLSGALIEGKRPSIETFLHSITARYTLHSHPIGVAAYASRKDGMEKLREMFPEAALVGYETPGIRLAKAFFRELCGEKKPRIIFMKNHGLTVSSDDLGEAVKLQSEVCERVDASLGLDTKGFSAGRRLFDGLWKAGFGTIAYRAETPAVASAFEGDGELRFAFSPDCVAYCGAEIVELESAEPGYIAETFARYGAVKAVRYEGLVFALADNVRKAKDIVGLLDYAAKIKLAGGEPEELPREERLRILNWDSEKYRTSL